MIINGTKFNIPALQNNGIMRKNSENQKVGTNFGGMANRFDRFILNNIIEESTDTETDGMTEIKKMLTDINTEEKQTDLKTALECYSLMQNLLQGEIRGAEGQIERFNKLSEEKKYYQGLLDGAEDDVITVNSGRYLLSGIQDGAKVSRKDIEAAVAYVERKISDDLICRKVYFIEDVPERPSEDDFVQYDENGIAHAAIPDMSKLAADEKFSEILRNGNSKYYRELTKVFSEATGIDMGFGGDYSELFSKEGYTEENFVEKTLERIEALKSASQNLKNTMCDWLETQISEKVITIESTGIDINMLLKMRESFSDFDLLETLSEEKESSVKTEL